MGVVVHRNQHGDVDEKMACPPDDLDSQIASSSTSSEDAVELKVNDADLPTSCIQKALAFYITNQFPIHILVAIALARAYPQLGSEYLATEYTASWIAVAVIFFISGLGLQVKDFIHAITQVKFNIFVQVFNFFFISIVTFAFCKFLTTTHALSDVLADGLVISSCIPTAINAVIVLAAAAGANEAAAVFNAMMGNIVGIFLSPVMILLYVGTKGEVPLGDVFFKLILRVVVPLFVGQCLRYTIAAIPPFVARYKSVFRRTSESCLVFIIYSVFCTTFTDDNSAGLAEVFKMIGYLILLCVFFIVTSWYLFQCCFHDEPELRVTGFMASSQKTAALGVPIIHSIYAGDPNEGLYTLPILIWHPMMVVMCSILIPRLSKFIKDERIRIAADNDLAHESIPSQVDPEAGVEHNKQDANYSVATDANSSLAEDNSV
jgi:solute carrier family 10 (sodium/bile acid cotransporter), member 7